MRTKSSVLAVRLGLLGVAGLAVAVGVTTASAGTLPAPPSPAPSTAVADPLHRFRTQTLRWKKCTPGMRQGQDPVKGELCALLTVPLDYARPDGPTIKVAVGRIGDGAHPVLMMNPGGPGGGGVGMVGEFRDWAPKRVVDAYDLVGLNPRGLTGGSKPLSCGSSMTAGESDMAFGSLNAYRPSAFADRVKAAQGIADKCAAAGGPDLAHYTTANTARDMDLLRSALRVPEISYLGVSYGTYLGAVYAQLFPDHIGRMILDSSVDPVAFTSPGWMRAFAPQSEEAFTHWTQWASGHDDRYHLGQSPEAVRETFYQVVAHMGPDAGGALRETMRRDVYDVKEASKYVMEHRDDTSPWMAPEGPDTAVEPVDAAINGVYYADVCGESRGWPTDPHQYEQAAIETLKTYPLAGDIANDITPCAFWKYPSAEPPVSISNAVPMLMLQNQWDGQTPLSGALNAHSALRGSRMVTVTNGQGHGIYLEKGNACALDQATAYLLTGTLPNEDLTCTAAVPQP